MPGSRFPVSSARKSFSPPRIEPRSQRCFEHRRNPRQPLHAGLELLRRLKQELRVKVGIQFDGFNLQPPQNGREEIRRVGVGVIDHHLKIACNAGDCVGTQRAKKHIGVDLIDMLHFVDAPDFVEIDPPVIFAEEDPFDLAFGGGVDIEAVGIEELDVHHATVERRQSNVGAAGRIDGAGDHARDRQWHIVKFGHVHASDGNPATNPRLIMRGV